MLRPTMSRETKQAGATTTVRVLSMGAGWRVSDIVCRSGPQDPAFEEAHASVSVSAVLSGGFSYRSTFGRALMTPGSLLLGNDGACFCCSHDHGTGDRCVAYHFEPWLLEEVASELPGARRIGFSQHRLPPIDALAPLFASTRALLDHPDQLIGEETAHRMAGAALRIVHDAEEPRATLADEARAAEAVAFIVQGFAMPLSLGDMAAAVGLGRYHFVRLFRRVVGTTPYQYLLNRRLAGAADALRGGSDVLGAALGNGFTDLSEFTRRFGAKFGQSPGAYRRCANGTAVAGTYICPSGPNPMSQPIGFDISS